MGVGVEVGFGVGEGVEVGGAIVVVRMCTSTTIIPCVSGSPAFRAIPRLLFSTC